MHTQKGQIQVMDCVLMHCTIKLLTEAWITIDYDYNIVVSDKLTKADMDSETKAWIRHYDRHRIILPDHFLPGKDFIEYHNDMIFMR